MSRHVEVPVISHLDASAHVDTVSIEEPLEIWISYNGPDESLIELSLSITMRTPGEDEDLVIGFLFSEGIISCMDDVEGIEAFGPFTEPHNLQNQVKVKLRTGERVAEKDFQRYFYSNSSCGVCGKASIQALEMIHQPNIAETGFEISDSSLRRLPEKLRSFQHDFLQTGGLHGVALAASDGEILLTKEDIGRHNAMDKLIGHLVRANDLETKNKLVLVSSRASFELVQKALVADFPFFAAIGAPSSAALDLAAEFGMTLVGFLKGNDYNIYQGSHRIQK
jgi:FdhD protein